MTIRELRSLANMSIVEYSRYFNIPYRTIQNWDNGERECAEYIRELMEYKLRKEELIK